MARTKCARWRTSRVSPVLVMRDVRPADIVRVQDQLVMLATVDSNGHDKHDCLDRRVTKACRSR